jgi:hypothetical protein
MLCVQIQESIYHILYHMGGGRGSKCPSSACPSRTALYHGMEMGMQWCTEFTQLIPSNLFRKYIVGFMHSLKREAFNAMRTSLHNAELGDEHRMVDTGPPIAPNGSESVVLDANQLLPPPTNSISPEAVSASVAMAALVKAAINCVWDSQYILRTLIVSCDIMGFRPPKNYTISGSMSVRHKRPTTAVVHEQVLRELRSENPLSIPLDTLHQTFGRTSYILRLVCTVNARHAWPGDARTVAKRRHSHTPPLVGERVVAIRERVHRLMAIEPMITTTYAGNHPLFRTLEGSKLMGTFLMRLHEMLKDTETLINGVVDGAVIALCNQHWLHNLNKMWVERKNPVPEVGHTESPGGLFVVYTQMVEDLQFLNKLVSFDRSRIVRSLSTGVHHLECPLPGGYPAIVARLTVRTYIDWLHAFRTLFPASYNKWSIHQKNANRHTTTVYQTRLALNYPYYNTISLSIDKPPPDKNDTIEIDS